MFFIAGNSEMNVLISFLADKAKGKETFLGLLISVQAGYA